MSCIKCKNRLIPSQCGVCGGFVGFNCSWCDKFYYNQGGVPVFEYDEQMGIEDDLLEDVNGDQKKRHYRQIILAGFIALLFVIVVVLS